MAVKISKLFRNARFQKLSEKSKLLYIYLITNPDLNVVGVLSPILEVLYIELGISVSDLRIESKELIRYGFINVTEVDDIVYFIMPKHFDTVPKTEASVERVEKALATLPKKLVNYLFFLGIDTKAKVNKLVKPSASEVEDYSLSLGYLINPNTFIEFYDDQAKRFGKKDIWVDGRGTQVRDWKAKLRKVWCRPENKLKAIKDAPKGFETFFIKKDDVIMTPDGWKNGLPFSKSLVADIELKRKYIEVK